MIRSLDRGYAKGVQNAAALIISKTAKEIGLDLNPLIKVKSKETARARADGNWCVISQLPNLEFVSVYRCWMKMLRTHISKLEGRFIEDDDQVAVFLCASIINCENLREALIKTSQFLKICGDCELSLSASGNYVIFSIDTGREIDGAIGLIWDYLTICFFQKLFSWLIAEPLQISVNLKHKEIIGRELLIGIIDPIDIQFEKVENSIVFDRKILARPVVRTYRELRDIQQLAPIELLNINLEQSLSKRIEAAFRRELRENSTAPTVDTIAYSMGCSGATLRRHLAAENTSFQNLLSQCRRELAIELLKQGHITLDEISAKLGFSAPSGFSRAFKDWTGLAPSVFRRDVGWSGNKSSESIEGGENPTSAQCA